MRIRSTNVFSYLAWILAAQGDSAGKNIPHVSDKILSCLFSLKLKNIRDFKSSVEQKGGSVYLVLLHVKRSEGLSF